jgi:hypothetical protein
MSNKMNDVILGYVKGEKMNTITEKVYASMVTAKRAAKRANIENPTFKSLEDGRVVIGMGKTGRAGSGRKNERSADRSVITSRSTNKREAGMTREAGSTRIHVGRAPTVSKIESPVAAFRELFQANHGRLRRGELIELAVQKGIGRNTAATYYQKLNSEVTHN